MNHDKYARLVSMANQISQFFESRPTEEELRFLLDCIEGRKRYPVAQWPRAGNAPKVLS